MLPFTPKPTSDNSSPGGMAAWCEPPAPRPGTDPVVKQSVDAYRMVYLAALPQMLGAIRWPEGRVPEGVHTAFLPFLVSPTPFFLDTHLASSSLAFYNNDSLLRRNDAYAFTHSASMTINRWAVGVCPPIARFAPGSRSPALTNGDGSYAVSYAHLRWRQQPGRDIRQDVFPADAVWDPADPAYAERGVVVPGSPIAPARAAFALEHVSFEPVAPGDDPVLDQCCEPAVDAVSAVSPTSSADPTPGREVAGLHLSACRLAGPDNPYGFNDTFHRAVYRYETLASFLGRFHRKMVERFIAGGKAPHLTALTVGWRATQISRSCPNIAPAARGVPYGDTVELRNYFSSGNNPESFISDCRRALLGMYGRRKAWRVKPKPGCAIIPVLGAFDMGTFDRSVKGPVDGSTHPMFAPVPELCVTFLTVDRAKLEHLSPSASVLLSGDSAWDPDLLGDYVDYATGQAFTAGASRCFGCLGWSSVWASPADFEVRLSEFPACRRFMTRAAFCHQPKADDPDAKTSGGFFRALHANSSHSSRIFGDPRSAEFTVSSLFTRFAPALVPLGGDKPGQIVSAADFSDTRVNLSDYYPAIRTPSTHNPLDEWTHTGPGDLAPAQPVNWSPMLYGDWAVALPHGRRYLVWRLRFSAPNVLDSISPIDMDRPPKASQIASLFRRLCGSFAPGDSASPSDVRYVGKFPDFLRLPPYGDASGNDD